MQYPQVRCSFKVMRGEIQIQGDGTNQFAFMKTIGTFDREPRRILSKSHEGRSPTVLVIPLTIVLCAKTPAEKRQIKARGLYFDSKSAC